MNLHHHPRGFLLAPQRTDRQALGFVLLTVASTTVWVGLYAGLTAKAIGLF